MYRRPTSEVDKNRPGAMWICIINHLHISSKTMHASAPIFVGYFWLKRIKFKGWSYVTSVLFLFFYRGDNVNESYYSTITNEQI